MNFFRKFIFVWACFGLGFIFSKDKRQNIYGVEHINEQPAYVVNSGRPEFTDMWYLSSNNAEIHKGHKPSPSMIDWSMGQIAIPKDVTGELKTGNRFVLAYKIVNDVGYVSNDKSNWVPLKVRVLKKGPTKIDKRRTFLMQVYLDCDFFAGAYDIIEKKPLGWCGSKPCRTDY